MHTSLENIDIIYTKRKPKSVSTFLKRTYELLNHQQNSNCVKWAPNGIGFIVINQQLFAKTVLPKYFKHNNYSSFVRQVLRDLIQLNMYNFHKIREHNSQNYFRHQYFNQNNKSAMSEIRRKPQHKRKKHSFEGENNEQQSQSYSPIKNRKQKQKNHDDHDHNEQKMESLNGVSIDFLKEYNGQKEKPLISDDKHSTKHMLSQTFYAYQQQNSKIQSQKIKFDQNRVEYSQKMLSIEDDDELSINDELTERIPRMATKELFCPSNSNLLPMMVNPQASTLSLFQ